ncbi:MAG: tetratricopeptide repeat protein [Planctomycetes bacterium]|nr:tetratricopeptide repeat protein [Planctomycetota bacterium]
MIARSPTVARKLALGATIPLGLALASCRSDCEPRDLPTIIAPALEHFAPLARAPIMQAYEHLLQDPMDADRNGVLGMLYHGHELHTAAERYYRRATLLAPDDLRWAYLLGHVRLDAGRVTAAHLAFQSAERIRGDYPPLQLAFADRCLDRGRIDEAAERYQRVWDSGTNSLAATLGIARCEMKAGHPDAAIDRLRVAAEMSPDVRAVRYALAMAYRDAGRLDDATREFLTVESARKSVPSDDPLLNQVRGLGIGREAMAAFTSADEAAEAGRVREASSIYERVLELNPDYVPALCRLGGNLIQLGESDRALALLRRAAALDPRHAYTQNYLGWALNGRGDHQSAERHLRVAIDLDPYMVDAHINLAEALVRTNRPQEAVQTLRNALTVDADHLAARYRLGKLLAALNETDQAAAEYERILKSDPTLIEIRMELAALLEAQGRLGQCALHLETALRFDPSHQAAARALARVRGRIDGPTDGD